MKVFEGQFLIFHGMITIISLFFFLLQILIWLLEEPSDPREQESSQVFQEPDVEQLAEMNFFVEDFCCFVALVLLFVAYYQSVDYIFFL